MTNSWRNSALVRMLGSALSWFLFSVCFGLLFQTSQVVM